jgi:hypothetical protein
MKIENTMQSSNTHVHLEFHTQIVISTSTIIANLHPQRRESLAEVHECTIKTIKMKASTRSNFRKVPTQLSIVLNSSYSITTDSLPPNKKGISFASCS